MKDLHSITITARIKVDVDQWHEKWPNLYSRFIFTQDYNGLRRHIVDVLADQLKAQGLICEITNYELKFDSDFGGSSNDADA